METGIVIRKFCQEQYEPGSGRLYLPILGNIFPKLFKLSMKPSDRWFVVVQNESFYRYEVAKEVYDAVVIGDKVSIETDEYGMPTIRCFHNK